MPRQPSILTFMLMMALSGRVHILAHGAADSHEPSTVSYSHTEAET
jgi:hypothetical protein